MVVQGVLCVRQKLDLYCMIYCKKSLGLNSISYLFCIHEMSLYVSFVQIHSCVSISGHAVEVVGEDEVDDVEVVDRRMLSFPIDEVHLFSLNEIRIE